MRQALIVTLLLLPVFASAERTVVFEWTVDYTQTNGTAIAKDDLVVTVYDEFEQEVCTDVNTCSTTQPWDTCITYFAVSTQISTSLQSAPSAGVASCTGPLPVLDTPPTAPVLDAKINLDAY